MATNNIINTPFINDTWIPELKFGLLPTGITYVEQLGDYTINGNVVTFRLWIVLSSKGTATGVATTNLPIPMRAAAVGSFYTPFTIIAGFNNTPTVIAYGAPSSTRIVLASYSTSGVITNIDDTNFTNSSSILISGSYLV